MIVLDRRVAERLPEAVLERGYRGAHDGPLGGARTGGPRRGVDSEDRLEFAVADLTAGAGWDDAVARHAIT